MTIDYSNTSNNNQQIVPIATQVDYLTNDEPDIPVTTATPVVAAPLGDFSQALNSYTTSAATTLPNSSGTTDYDKPTSSSTTSYGNNYSTPNYNYNGTASNNNTHVNTVLHRHKQARKRSQAVAAVSGGVIGGILLGPIGLVAGSLILHGTTKASGRRRERKLRERLEQQQQATVY